MIRRVLIAISLAGGLLLPTLAPAADGESTRKLVATLNADDSIRGDESSLAYKLLFDAYLKVSDPPMPVGSRFNSSTIWPGMSGWSDVSKWAGANPAMAEAIIKAADRAVIGLPYGCGNVPDSYSQAGLCVDIDVDKGFRAVDFNYLSSLKTIAAYTTAEIYRRFESGDIDGAITLMTSELTVLRMFCDRQFMEEKRETILLLTQSLSNARDCFWTYMDKISADQFLDIAKRELPYLRPDRARLLIPEADRHVTEAVLVEVFDNETGEPIIDRFAEVFTRIQASQEPLTRLGAATRWREIAMQHGGLEACQERLQLIYDDWWRRWRLREYGDILTMPSEFDKTNAMRYAGVLISMQNIQELFAIRNNLRVAVYGTAISAALCAFKRETGNYPPEVNSKADRLYGTYLPRKLDQDPYHYKEELNGLDGFRYRLLTRRHALFVAGDRIWLESGEALLYSLGENQENDLGEEHVSKGEEGDIIIWPPIRALLRQDGKLQ
ncbi:MAG: hypothetical protein MK116_00805 [Phycisphaerales bacterium]|nr:hypothetical protein [Phycisphaerales bacterium]